MYRMLAGLCFIQPLLMDDTGNRLASVLLTYIMKAGKLPRLEVRGTRAGSYGTVKHILRLPSGRKYLYTGWPDFQITTTLTREERQLHCMNVGEGARETVRGIGEVQSPPGCSARAKSRALAQVGIYALGHFNNTTTVDSIATIVLYKDMTAHVALATIQRNEEEVGEDAPRVTVKVEFKIVYDVSPFNLRDTSDILLFPEVFIATLRSVMG